MNWVIKITARIAYRDSRVKEFVREYPCAQEPTDAEIKETRVQHARTYEAVFGIRPDQVEIEVTPKSDDNDEGAYVS